MQIHLLITQLLQVKYDGQTQYLTAVCMGCLEGVSPDRDIRCRYVPLSIELENYFI